MMSFVSCKSTCVLLINFYTSLQHSCNVTRVANLRYCEQIIVLKVVDFDYVKCILVWPTGNCC